MTNARLALAIAISMVCTAGSVAKAAMAPNLERWAEPQAVMTDNTVARKLSEHGAVERIDVTLRGAYRVWAGKCYLDATIRRRVSQPRAATPSSESR